MVKKELYLTEKQALELIELRQSLGLEKPLTSEELNKLKKEMCTCTTGNRHKVYK